MHLFLKSKIIVHKIYNNNHKSKKIKKIRNISKSIISEKKTKI